MRQIPNLLTGVRIALTPFLGAAIARGDCVPALWLCGLAGATDAADGFLARRFGWATRAGAYLDPVADKFLLTVVYLSLAAGGQAPLWLTLLVIARDLVILGMAGIGLLLTNIRDFPPSLWGKISTVVQISGALVWLSACAGWAPGQSAQEVAVDAVAAATAWSGVHYFWRGVCTWIGVRRRRE